MRPKRFLPSALLAVLLIISLPSFAQDIDADLMPDTYELAHPCLNASVPDGNLDPDNDGMTSLAEYNIAALLDPCLADTDGDGLPDGWEAQNQACGFNPVSKDSEVVPAKIGPDLRVTSNPSDSMLPSISWTGSEFGVSWEDYRDGNDEIYFARVSAAGVKIGADLRVTSNARDSKNPSLFWTGSEFGVSWEDSRNGTSEIYFARVTAEGAKIGADLRVTNGLSYIFSADPSLAWTGSEFGVCWEDNRDGNSHIYFARVSAAGEKIGDDVPITNDAANGDIPSLTWTGSEFGVSWRDWRNGNFEIYFGRVSAAGAKSGTELRVTSAAGDAAAPSLSWTGSEFGVSWQDTRDGGYLNDEIYFARVSADGEKIGADVRVTSDSYLSATPWLSWTGSEFGVSWREDLETSAEFYFSRISAAGAKIGADFQVTVNASGDWGPSLSWTGSEFGLAWTGFRDGNNEIYFARIAADAGRYSDKDGDGLREDQEYAMGTNPCNPDTDGDGLPDGWEVEYQGCGFNPRSWDSEKFYAPIDPKLRVTSAEAESNVPSLVWTGSEYGVSWQDNRDGNGEIYFGRVSALGAKIGADARISEDGGGSQSASLAWTGSEYGVSWSDDRDGNQEIYFARVSGAGARIGAEFRVTEAGGNSQGPSLVWTGSEYGLSWNDNRDGNDEIYFARISAAGVKVGSEVRLTSVAGASTSASLVWTGSEFGVNWIDHRNGKDEIYFARISVEGVRVGPELRVTTDIGSSPSLAWTGSEYGMIWEGMHGWLNFARVSAAGEKIGPDLGISNLAVGNSLVWTGSEFGACWDTFAMPVSRLYFARISAEGVKIGTERRINDNPDPTRAPSLAWTGSEFGASWAEDLYHNNEIYFARIGAVYTDKDADGLGEGGEYRLGADPCDPDTDGDQMNDGFEEAYAGCAGLDPLLAGNTVGDGDLDGLSNLGEFQAHTNPCDPDSDDDGLSDGDEVKEFFTDPLNPDSDDDGLNDRDEIMVYFTDPLDADSDHDGFIDGDEIYCHLDPHDPDSDHDDLVDSEETRVIAAAAFPWGMIFRAVFCTGNNGTLPDDWDTDGDFLPDGFEVHSWDTHPEDGLSATDPADGSADFDEDGNSNANEYWNGSDPWTIDPTPGAYENPGCYYWGDGDGDGNPAPSDLVMMKLEIAGVGQEYREILPHGTDTLDLDRDGHVAPSDEVMLRLMIAGSEQPGGYPSQALALEVVDAPSGSVAVGSTTHVTVSVHSVSGDPAYAPGFGVVFEVVSGNAVLLGGDGTANGEAEGNRYDFSMEAAAGARANMVVLVTGSGPITIGAKIPECGAEPNGRWNDEVLLSSPVVINP